MPFDNFATRSGTQSLSAARAGVCGIIREVRGHGNQADELERRLLEFGIIEGAAFKIVHEGPIAHDPMVLDIDGMRLALRRQDAQGVLIETGAG